MAIIWVYTTCTHLSQHKRHPLGDGDHYVLRITKITFIDTPLIPGTLKKKKSSGTGISLCQVEIRLFFSHLFSAISLCWQSASVSAYDISECVRVICYINWSGLSLQLCPWRDRARHRENKKRGGGEKEKEKESRSNSCVRIYMLFMVV